MLKGECIENRAVRIFIGRNYAPDDHGRWFFQNGPQRVFVTLDATPWVFRLDAGGSLITHTGVEVRRAHAAFMDEQGNVVVDTALGAGLLDDRDLDVFSERLRDRHGRCMAEEALIEAVDQMRAAAPVVLQALLHEVVVPLRFMARDELPARLGFVRDPQPDESER